MLPGCAGPSRLDRNLIRSNQYDCSRSPYLSSSLRLLYTYLFIFAIVSSLCASVRYQELFFISAIMEEKYNFVKLNLQYSQSPLLIEVQYSGFILALKRKKENNDNKRTPNVVYPDTFLSVLALHFLQ